MGIWLEADSEINRELTGSERLLWTHRPRQGVVFRASDAFMIPFSLMWGGFAIFWETTAIIGGAPLFFALWGVPFVLVGLYMIFGRFFVDAKLRQRTFYGLTDQRLIIVSGLASRKVTSLNLQTLSDLSLAEKGDGSGTITFGAVQQTPWYPRRMAFFSTPVPGSALEMIPNAREVYELIREAQANT